MNSATARAAIEGWSQQKTAKWIGEIALMAAVAVIVDLQIHLTSEPGSRPVDAVAYLFGVLFALPLPARHRWPLAVLVFCIVVFFVYNAVNYPGFSPVLSWAIPLYSAAKAGQMWFTVLWAAIALGLTLLFSTVKLVPGVPAATAEALLETALLAALILLGETVRSRRALAEQMRKSAELAEADRERDWQRRLTEERLHIARELHDVLAHTLTAAALQAGIASDSLTDAPEASRTALAAVRASYRQARTELAATVDVLRAARTDIDTDDSTAGAPSAGLAHLDTLVGGMRGAGVRIDVDIAGQQRPLPPAVDLTAYRIVQQALTNVVQHARARSATVSLTYQPADLVISVVDDGSGADVEAPKPPRGPGGFGVIGMRERAIAIGGHLTAGPRPDGGFAVTATLPCAQEGC